MALVHRVQRSVHLAAPPDEVWRVLLDPERAPGWLGGFRLEVEPVVGGRFALVGSLGEGAYAERGEVLAFDPARLLRFSHWSALWRVPDVAESRAVMTWSLEPAAAPGGTTLSIVHELPDVEAIAEHSDFFWRVGLARLAAMVARP